MMYAIDFGTTNSLLGGVKGSEVIPPIPLDKAAKDPTILRSVLFFPTRARCFYGAEAIEQFVSHDMEGRLIRSIKKFLPMRSFIGTYVEDRPLNLEDIIGVFLGEMRRRANAYFNEDVDTVLLGRPAKFAEREEDDRYAEFRLKRSAEIAGFKNIQFCPEPVAAAYEFKSTLKEPKTVLVADFGGGTSDFTVVRLSQAKYKQSDVLSIGGVALAGDALDGWIMRKRVSTHFGLGVQYQVPFGSNVLTMPVSLMEKICSPAHISLLRKRDTVEFFRNVEKWALTAEDRAKMERLFSLIHDQIGFELFEEIERTKRMLSSQDKEVLVFSRPNMEVKEEISRKQFDLYAEDALEKILASLDETVKASGLSFDKIDLVCCTGGTAKVAAIQEGLFRRFGREKVQEHRHFHSIAEGLGKVARDIFS